MIAPFAVGMMWFESSEGIVGAINFSLNADLRAAGGAGGRRGRGGVGEGIAR